jgi:uncharacterized protein
MLGLLSDAQIDLVLHTEIVGRIGCYNDKKMYVVPVTYVYHDGYIYAHSKEGLKIQMMRKNPNVCFEVDIMENMTNWRSVIIWGEYEELKKEKDQQTGKKIMMDRFAPFTVSETIRPVDSASLMPRIVEKAFRTVAYRIKVIEKTGRFEKT